MVLFAVTAAVKINHDRGHKNRYGNPHADVGDPVKFVWSRHAGRHFAQRRAKNKHLDVYRDVTQIGRPDPIQTITRRVFGNMADKAGKPGQKNQQSRGVSGHNFLAGKNLLKHFPQSGTRNWQIFP